MVSIEKQFKYIYNLEFIYVYYKKYYNKLNKNIKSLFLYNGVININKLPNTLIKLYYLNSNYFNNLPLNLKFLECNRFYCNLPPKILYLDCDYCDINNLPRSLQFIYINYNKFIIPTELINHNYNKNKIKFIDYYYDNIIKLKSIY